MTLASDRVAELRRGFPEAGIDALVVTHPTNIRYLAGFTGSSGTLVVTGGEATLVTDSRYALRAPDEIRAHSASVDVVVGAGAGHSDVRSLLDGVGRVGLEAAHVSWDAAERFRTEADDAQVVATTGLVEAIRMTKSADEVERIRTAAAIADSALVDVRDLLATGPTESEVVAALEEAMRVHGADRAGFDPIVASGPNAARPHHAPGDRRIEAGDLVIIDFGAEVGGYRSDMTRSFVIGPPEVRQTELLDAVRRAQAAGVATAGPGVEASDVDRACRESLEADGLAQFFTHGTGHGVGLDIHEAPSVSATSTATLAAGHVITVEPGVYLPDEGGVRWEDTVVITADGVDVVTRSAKEPIVSL